MAGGVMPSPPSLALALLYSAGAHGIMTLNDFKAVEGDRQMGVRSLPVQLGPPRGPWRRSPWRPRAWALSSPRPPPRRPEPSGGFLNAVDKVHGILRDSMNYVLIALGAYLLFMTLNIVGVQIAARAQMLHLVDQPGGQHGVEALADAGVQPAAIYRFKGNKVASPRG